MRCVIVWLPSDMTWAHFSIKITRLLSFFSFIPLLFQFEFIKSFSGYFYLSEVNGEGSKVRHSGRRQKDVPGDVGDSLTKQTSSLCPSVLFSTKSTNQLLSSVQLLLTDINVCLQLFLLLCHSFKLIVQSLQLVCDLLDEENAKLKF